MQLYESVKTYLSGNKEVSHGGKLKKCLLNQHSMES